jgi:cell division protein FtsN
MGATAVAPFTFLNLLVEDRSNTQKVAESQPMVSVRTEIVSAPEVSSQSDAAVQDSPSQDGRSLQVGAYRDEASAVGLASRLKSIGINMKVERQGALHSIRLGHFKSEEEARFGKKLMKDGTVVAFIIVG